MSKPYVEAPPKLRWFLVEKKELAGGGDYKTIYAIEAINTTEAVEIAMKHPHEFEYSQTVSVSVVEEDITVMHHA